MKIVKKFKAEVGHRLTKAFSKRCLGLHGHSYIFEIALESNKLDDNQMVMDFGELKAKIGSFMDAFDHSLVIDYRDTFLIENADRLNNRYMIVNYNPTAENMAQHIFNYCVDNKLPVSEVIVHETTTGRAICNIYDGITGNNTIYSKSLKEEYGRNI